MGALDKEKMGVLGGTENDDVRIYHATQNSTQIQTYKLFISVILHLILLD